MVKYKIEGRKGPATLGFTVHNEGLAFAHRSVGALGLVYLGE